MRLDLICLHFYLFCKKTIKNCKTLLSSNKKLLCVIYCVRMYSKKPQKKILSQRFCSLWNSEKHFPEKCGILFPKNCSFNLQFYVGSYMSCQTQSQIPNYEPNLACSKELWPDNLLGKQNSKFCLRNNEIDETDEIVNILWDVKTRQEEEFIFKVSVSSLAGIGDSCQRS